MDITVTLSDGRTLKVLPKPRWWQLRAWWGWLRSDRVFITTADGRVSVLRIPKGSL